MLSVFEEALGSTDNEAAEIFGSRVEPRSYSRPYVCLDKHRDFLLFQILSKLFRSGRSHFK